MKNILISTGGSGGHTVPAKIIYEHLKREFNLFISSDDRGIKFLDKEEYNIKIIDVPKISKNIFLLPVQIFSLMLTIIKSFFFLKEKKIEILISTGGYMSLPLCVASKILNIKLFLFEPNLVLGRANKFFIHYCHKIFCYSNKIKNFPNNLKYKISIIPPLLRKEFYNLKETNITDKNISLLIIGGSQGAKSFDEMAQSSIIDLSKKYKFKVYQQTNQKNFESLKLFYQANEIEYELFDFNENILALMSKANICLTRAGASTLAELVFLNIPHLAIPLPKAKDNHQFENASFYNQLGCNWILNQNEINDTDLTNKLFNIIDNKEEYLNKKMNMKNFSYQNTWNNINQKIISTINEN
jgi:UDP-N-acetylglucosamine--N-acetylmuramyl-(pentapeptide) pyrophosphoryl-undecaprenol N-acetylglucosamine transferase